MPRALAIFINVSIVGFGFAPDFSSLYPILTQNPAGAGFAGEGGPNRSRTGVPWLRTKCPDH